MVRLRFYRVTADAYTQYSEWLGPFESVRVQGDEILTSLGIRLAMFSIDVWIGADGRQWEGVLIRDEHGEQKVSLN